jgi:uncharacterized membrane protein YpjA
MDFNFQNFIFGNKHILFFLFLINFLVGVYSISYYFWKLPSVNPLLWFFVIDCPLYTIFLSFIFLLKFFNKSIPFFEFIVIVGLIKYSFWTFFSLFLHGNLFSLNPEFLIVVFSHLLMFLQTFLFYKKFIVKFNFLIVCIFWFLFNDFLDYFLLLHPYFENQFFGQIMIFSIFSSILVSLFVFIANNSSST